MIFCHTENHDMQKQIDALFVAVRFLISTHNNPLQINIFTEVTILAKKYILPIRFPMVYSLRI